MAGGLAGWRFAWFGAWLGTSLWALLDAWRGRCLLNILRTDATALPARGPGVWGELAERIRHLLRAREQETRQAEVRLEEFLAAIQASPNGVVLLDEQGRIEWCNQTAAMQFGIDAERDLLQHLANLVRDPAFVAYLASWSYSRDVLINAPSNAGTRHGHLMRLSVQVHTYADNRRMVLTRDITALEQADAMRRDFVANVSHEIRTPLTVLAGFVETLQNLPLSIEERTRYLALMAAQSHRMETLVNDLLTLSRLEGNAPPPGHQWTPVRALLAHSEDEAKGLSNRISPQGHRLDVKIEAESELGGAATELQSAMSNLLSNAVQHGSQQSPVTLTADGEVDAIVLKVSNSGDAIPADALRAIFEPLVRAPNASAEVHERSRTSLGLGLFIVREIVLAHGGSITVESSAAAGTVFTIRLPRSPA